MKDKQRRMNTHFARMLGSVLDNAERDVLLAHSHQDKTALAKAQARLDSLKSAQDIYAAAHKLAYGVRPEHE